MRLTAEILSRAEQFINPAREREINLRGFKIPLVENIAVLQDQFDVIDFSDNEIKRLDNFPRTKRLSSIVVNNNYVSRVGKLGENVPNLRYLVLTNNRLSSLTEIQNIATCQKLEHLSLLENSITQRPHYRLYVIHMIPTLKTLDYKKVEKKERDASKKFFKSAEGKQLLESIELERKAKAEGAVDTGATGAATAAALKPAIVLTEEQKKLVRAAIEAASTKEEIDAIERHLKAGNLSFLYKHQQAAVTSATPSAAAPSVAPTTVSATTTAAAAVEDADMDMDEEEANHSSSVPVAVPPPPPAAEAVTAPAAVQPEPEPQPEPASETAPEPAAAAAGADEHEDVAEDKEEEAEAVEEDSPKKKRGRPSKAAATGKSKKAKK